MNKTWFLAVCFGLAISLCSVKAQSSTPKQLLDYYELKGLLLKHKATIESILGMKRFKLSSSKERSESTVHVYKKENDSSQVFIRVRKSDGLVSEIAWHEKPSTIAYLTHDAIDDGFVPVAGGGRYYNHILKAALMLNYRLAHEDSSVPCVLRAVDQSLGYFPESR